MRGTKKKGLRVSFGFPCQAENKIESVSKPQEKTDKLLKEAELCETFGTSSPYTPTVLWSGIKGRRDGSLFCLLCIAAAGP